LIAAKANNIDFGSSPGDRLSCREPDIDLRGLVGGNAAFGTLFAVIALFLINCYGLCNGNCSSIAVLLAYLALVHIWARIGLTDSQPSASLPAMMRYGCKKA
jgi:hypothetical protein